GLCQQRRDAAPAKNGVSREREFLSGSPYRAASWPCFPAGGGSSSRKRCGRVAFLRFVEKRIRRRSVRDRPSSSAQRFRFRRYLGLAGVVHWNRSPLPAGILYSDCYGSEIVGFKSGSADE